MMAALIFVISFALLMQFFVAYCRSLIAAYRQVDLSDDAREVTGISDRLVRGEDFVRLLQLVRLCPEPGDDRLEIGAVRAYYGMLNLLRALSRSLAPAVASWTETEREGCSYFAAVALDRRIAHNRELMARQMSH